MVADVAAAYIDQIQGKEITANCDQTTSVCSISIQDFPIQLETPCQAGDCVSEKNPVLNSGDLLKPVQTRCTTDRCHISCAGMDIVVCVYRHVNNLLPTTDNP